MFALLQEDLRCWRDHDGDRLVVDTPHTLQDGHVFRFYVQGQTDGRLRISDDGFASRQVEMFAHSDSVLRERYADLKQIARELALDWDTEFSFIATDLKSALRRIPSLLRAVDQSLALPRGRGSRSQAVFEQRLAEKLREAGLTVLRRHAVDTQRGESVRVDYLVRRNGSEAAVELLGGSTTSRASSSVDRASANFRLLERGGYRGLRIAVYDELSAAASEKLRARFAQVSPPHVLLLPAREAVSRIVMELAP